jgi:carboxypeptidase Taq
MSTTQELYDKYKSRMQKIADLRYASGVLQWDQETYLPPKGAQYRGQQISTLSEISHQMFTDNELGDLLQELKTKDDLPEGDKRNVVRTLEDYSKE